MSKCQSCEKSSAHPVRYCTDCGFDIHTKRVADEIAKFPTTFGLRAHTGTFRISAIASYVNDDDRITLYLQRELRAPEWQDFCKSSVNDLVREILIPVE